jgi:signal transduction histidine kinase
MGSRREGAQKGNGMQAMGSTVVAERRRVEAVVETLAAIHNHGESLVELAHDARNMVTALSLYCDLLEEPGVLSAAHRHYGSELRLVAEASRSLVEKLARLDDPAPDDPKLDDPNENDRADRRPASDFSLQGRLFPESPRTERPAARSGQGPVHLKPVNDLPNNQLDDLLIGDVEEEVLASRNVLAAVAGPSIALTVDGDGGALPVRMTSEDLIRVLVNLVKNAAEGMAGAGTIELGLTTRKNAAGEASAVILAVEDTGAGIPQDLLERVFEPGFTTRASPPAGAGWVSGGRRGLGLAITRGIVEAAGGTIHAGNRAGGGARFVIELPVRSS